MSMDRHAGFQEGSQFEGRADGPHPCQDECLSTKFLSGVFGSLSEGIDLRNLLILLVAGVGFEPTTFGL